ncbi:MAG: trigger factor [Solobacterium sp.]|nr:trigger factor [Solobacterium sp.]
MSEWTLKEKSVGELVVTVEGDEWKKAVEKSFNKLAKKVQIDGFRKGAVPKKLLEKKVPVQERQIQAIEDNANDWLQKGMAECGVTPIDRPSLDIKSVDDEKAVVVFEFPVKPEAKLGEYKGLPYSMDSIEVTEDELNAELNRMRETYSDMEVKDGEAENGDTVNIDYQGLKDGVAFDGGTAEKYDLVLGSGSFIPGFEEQLVGVKAGDEKDLNLKFPEDYHSADLAGAEVVFKVKVNEVKTKVLPELDDDFAQDVNAPGVETVDDLKKLVRERLEGNKKNAAESKADSELFDRLAANAEVDIPEVMIKDEVEGMINQMSSQISQYGMKLDQYLSMMGQKIEDLRESYRENAEKSVKLRLVLEAVAKAENLVAGEEDINKEYENIAQQYDMDVERVKALVDPEMLKADVVNQLAYKFVKDNAAKA